jgi:hypothetical protein
MEELLREIAVPIILGAVGGAIAHFWWLRQHVQQIRRDYDEEIRRERMSVIDCFQAT